MGKVHEDCDNGNNDQRIHAAISVGGVILLLLVFPIGTQVRHPGGLDPFWLVTFAGAIVHCIYNIFLIILFTKLFKLIAVFCLSLSSLVIIELIIFAINHI